MAADGLRGLGLGRRAAAVQKSEDYFEGASELHGAGGEWRVENARLHWDVLDAFRDAAVAAGIPAIDDFNRGDNEGVSYFKVNQKHGIRWNSAKAFLRPARDRGNLRVETGAHVRRIEIEELRATGVTFDQNGTTRTVKAKREVILAAGAVGSPQILELSGVGRGDVLQQAGIPVKLERRQLGENLQDHLQLRCAYKVTGIPTLNEKASKLVGKAMIGLEYLLRRSGPMSMAPSQLGAFTRSDPSYETANLQYHVQPLSLEKFGEAVHPFPAFTASVCNLRPDSRGSIHVKSPDHRTQPAIRPNYLATESDRRVAADAIRLTRHIVAQAPCKNIVRRNLSPAQAMKRRKSSKRRLATSEPRSSIPSAPAAWDRTRKLSSILVCASTALRACVSRTPPSCRPSPPATPIRPPS